jgi:hypothetical protein
MASGDADGVRVFIEVVQTAQYRQIVQMPRERWEAIKKMPPDVVKDADGVIADLMDGPDCEAWDFEDITLYVVDKGVNPVDPPDRYESGA